MDIGAVSICMNQAKVQDAVSLSLMKMVMNNGEQTMEAMTDMIAKSAVNPNLGQHFDSRA